MRWTVVPVSLTLVLIASCNADEPQAAPNSVEAEAPAPEGPVLPPVGARVLIRDARGLATEAKRDAARVFGSAAGDELRVAEVVAHVGEFVELRSVAGEPSDVCTAVVGVNPSFELHFFALPEELERVLGTPKRVELDDGTKLEFAAGVPIVGAGPDAALRVGSAEFVVPLAADEIATWFQAAPVEEPSGRVAWPLGRPLHYGERQITGTIDPPFAVAQAKQAIEGGTLLSFASACGRFTLRTDAVIEDPEPGHYPMKGPKDAIPQMARDFDPDMAARQAGILAVLEDEKSDGRFLASPYGGAFADDIEVDEWGACVPSVQWTAPAKTELRWQQTGTPAGFVIDETVLPASAGERDDQICFVATGVGVCIATSKLQRREQACDDEPGLGLIGKDSDPGFGGRGQRIPKVQQEKAQIGEGLDQDIIRRIVRAHVNEVRSCYNAGLREHPELAGRVTIAFMIGANGKVGVSTVQQDTLEPADEAVGRCIAKAVKRWMFPKPKDGATVSVVYPFVLEPG